jgi:hypothetical protein
MPSFTGTYRHEARGDVQIEFNQRDGGQRWHVVVKNGMTRREVSIWEPANPWEAMRNLVADVLNDAQGDSEPSRFDMNQRLIKRPVAPTPIALRRRGKFPPGSLPEWRPPETD